MLMKNTEKVGQAGGVGADGKSGIGGGPSGRRRAPAAAWEQVEGATLVVGMGSGSLSWLPRTCSEV